MKRVLLAVVCALVGCGAEVEGGGAPDESAIQGGASDPKHAAVGLLWFQGGGLCTGSLIAPDVVLTAGHCVETPIEGFYLGRGEARSSATRPPESMTRHAVTSWVAHPSYHGVWACPLDEADVGLVRLAAPVEGVRPIPVRAGAPPGAGTRCTAVGYGRHDPPEGGAATYLEKRRATERILGHSPGAVEVEMVDGIVDPGDSGGPLLCGGRISGVTSCKTDGEWPAHRRAFYARVDIIKKWIDETQVAWREGRRAGDCAHPLCSPGERLVPSCDPCVAEVCAADPFCCNQQWDQACMKQLGPTCGITCNPRE
jgi:hypothetical protein